MKISHWEGIANMDVSRFAFKAALLQDGILKATDDKLMGDKKLDPLVKLTWTDAPRFHRDSLMTIKMAHACEWSDAEVDQLFIAARRLEV